eukprot:gene14496-16003_t
MRLKPEKIEVTKTKKIQEVSTEQKNQLQMLLEEYRRNLNHRRMIHLPNTYSEFNAFHINQVLSSSQHIFSLQDVYDHVEIWRKVYALSILSILKTVFEDIVEDVAFAGVPDFDQSMNSLPDEWVNIRDDSEAEDLLMWDISMLEFYCSVEECSYDTLHDGKDTSIDQPEKELSLSQL